MRKPRVLLVQASINPPGGGNGVAAWMVEALRTDCEVTVLTRVPTDWRTVNRFFGTSVDSTSVRALRCDRRPPRLAPRVVPMGLLNDLILMREARGLAPGFDLAITAMNEADLGSPAIQYVHYPRFDPVRPNVDLRWFHRAPGLLDAYRRAVVGLTGFSVPRMRMNLTLANSNWTANRFKTLHAKDANVLHPPIALGAPGAPWGERENRILMIGRISPEKRFEAGMKIVRTLRTLGHPLTLTIVGTDDDAAYTSKIRGDASNCGFAEIREGISREELGALLARSRYGLHCMENEHFGMAVAEMARAGVLVFAHRSGGPIEILNDSRLLYLDTEDAVRKISPALADPAFAEELAAALSSTSERFSAEAFCEQIRKTVFERLEAPLQ